LFVIVVKLLKKFYQKTGVLFGSGYCGFA